MSYGFNGSSSYVEFAIAPLSGDVYGGITIAALFRQFMTFDADILLGLATSANGDRMHLNVGNSEQAQYARGGNSEAGSLPSTTIWYLLVATCAAGNVPARFHVHNETSWSHFNGSGNAGADLTVAGTDRLYVGRRGSGSPWHYGEICCIGVKNADSSDVAAETLSRTSFSSWLAFGFDWLVGFETIAAVADLGLAGTGDEVARSGITLVSDPPSWSWSGVAAPPFVPQIVIT